jgi:predicted regulator of Ras-like GTPase activity (Roadblock/LC7/MglB family)
MNDLVKGKVPAWLSAAADREARRIVDEVAGAQAVVIATADGFDVASAMFTSVDATRIAALASSIAAIGEVVSIEARLGRTRSVTVDTDAGFAIVFSVPREEIPLVINVVAGTGAVLGEVNYRGAAATRALMDASASD